MWQYDSIQFREFNPVKLMWTQHRINTENLYHLTWEKKQGDRRYFSSYLYKFNMVNAFTRHLPTFKLSYLSYRKLLQVKKVYEIFCFCRRLYWQMINTRLLKGSRLLDMLQKGLDLQFFKKRDPGTDAFLWNLWNFQEHLFHRATPDDCFYDS